MWIEHQPSKLRVAGSSPAGRARSRLVKRDYDGGRSSVGRAPDCGSGRRGFESHRPPQTTSLLFDTVFGSITTVFGPLAQLVEQLTLNQLVVGSSPTRPTISNTRVFCPSISFVIHPERCCSPISIRGVCCPVYLQQVALATAFEFFSVFDGKSRQIARVAELVDALDLGSSGATRESSSLSFRTIHTTRPRDPVPGLYSLESG